MKFQVVSDLHLEMHKKIQILHFFKPDRTADCLLLAGDIGSPFTSTYESFLEQVSVIYKHVLLIAGNHEFYSSTIENSKEEIKKIVSKFHNIVFLDDSVYEFPEQKLAVLGTTLWSKIPKSMMTDIKHFMNDYRMIEDFTPMRSNELHEKHHNWLRNELSERKENGWKVIVMTHHLPSPKLISEKYNNPILNCSFASPLDEMMDPDLITAWISGHTHIPCTMKINGVYNIVNPHGYIDETDRRYDRIKTFIVE